MNISESLRDIDKPIFFGALGLLVLVAIPLIVFPEHGAAWVGSARGFITGHLGVLYLALNPAGIWLLFGAYVPSILNSAYWPDYRCQHHTGKKIRRELRAKNYTFQ